MSTFNLGSSSPPDSSVKVVSGKVLTVNNSLTLAGTDSTTMTFPSSSDTVAGLAAAQVVTNKDLTSTTNTFPSGFVFQIQTTNYNAVASGTGTIPNDDTIPQITEGVQFMSQTITPKSSTNHLLIEATISLAIQNNGNRICSMFQDSTANAIAAQATYVGAFTDPACLTMRYDMVAGTTSATTFTVRGGSEAGGTITMNGVNGARRFGGVTLSSIKITEYKP